jgi:hypothetical protein
MASNPAGVRTEAERRRREAYARSPRCVATRADPCGATVRIPTCCYVCYSDNERCTYITEKNSVVLSCRCELAVCQACARALFAEQDDTYLRGLACPGCGGVSRDVLMTRFLGDSQDANSVIPDSAAEVSGKVDRLVGQARVAARGGGGSAPGLPALYAQMVAHDWFVSLSAAWPSIDDFGALSPSRQQLTLARLEALRSGAVDPLTELRFSQHSSLLFAIRFATEGLALTDVDRQCMYCFQDLMGLDGRLPVQYICPKTCRHVLCQECAPVLLKEKEATVERREHTCNNYDVIRCLTRCSGMVRCFTQTEAAQQVEDDALAAAVKKILSARTGGRKTQKREDGTLKRIYEKLKELGVMTKCKFAETEFEMFDEDNNSKLLLAAITAYYFEHECMFLQRGGAKRRGCSSSSASSSAAAAAFAAAEMQEELPIPAFHALVAKPDLFLERLIQFRNEVDPDTSGIVDGVSAAASPAPMPPGPQLGPPAVTGDRWDGTAPAPTAAPAAVPAPVPASAPARKKKPYRRAALAVPPPSHSDPSAERGLIKAASAPLDISILAEHSIEKWRSFSYALFNLSSRRNSSPQVRSVRSVTCCISCIWYDVW